MTTIDLSLNQVCNQRRFQMLFTVPPVRYTPNNPYIDFPQYTKQDFDIRRKAEILKYKNPTQSNQLTKSQRWALLANGKSQKNSYPDITLHQKHIDANNNITYETIIIKYPNSYISVFDPSLNDFSYNIVPNGRLCARDLLIPTPTSSSDVPGPITNLYYDANVPLYNYVTNRNYGIINNNAKNSMWKLISSDNTDVPNTVLTNVMYLYIQDGIDSQAYLFNIKIPIAIYINDISSKNSSTITDFKIETVLNSSNINVYYNDLPVQFTNKISPVYKLNNQSINNSNNTFSFDVSYNSSYQAVYYVGILEISNLLLYTQPGYIYNFKLNCSIYSPSTMNAIYINSFSNNTNSGIFFNYNPFSTNIYNSNIDTYGCNINTLEPLLQNGIIISGVPYP